MEDVNGTTLEVGDVVECVEPWTGSAQITGGRIYKILKLSAGETCQVVDDHGVKTYWNCSRFKLKAHCEICNHSPEYCNCS